MSYYYVSLYHAIYEDWGNTRAAALGSLFPLKNFGKDENGKPLTDETLVSKVKMENSVDPKVNDLRAGYVVAETDFTLGYLMTAIANHQLALSSGDFHRNDEANDNFNKALSINPGLSNEISTIKSNACNTLLFVEYGTGPAKYGRGPDRAIADFYPLTPSDQSPLVVSQGSVDQNFPVVCDVNQMSQDHQWKNLEDVRRAKSYLGDAMLVGSAATLFVAANLHEYNQAGGNSGDAALILLGVSAILFALGLASKASAHANTSYCEAMPQRVYVVPLMITDPNSTVAVQVQNRPDSKLVLTGLQPAAKDHITVREVRMVTTDPIVFQP